MRLKSLSIHGFKSFADRTTFEFHKGVTGIVGPNGCGKSNVVDAIRWVLGETSAKALRGGEMADVIFNGTERLKPSGMASVTLTLLDCERALGVEFNELGITRRVYRDGKSEYLINNSLCRLRDIHDLFLDTGIGRSAYSMMEQGKIDQLLSSKPEERRTVFEEAAGIAKFKKEKKDAIRKLQQTDANLLRISDLFEEQERQLHSLKRQSSRAQQYKELTRDLRVLECHSAHHEYRELLAGKNQLAQSTARLQQNLKDQENLLNASRERTIEKQRKLTTDRETSFEYEKQFSTLTSEIKAAQNRIAFQNEKVAEYETQIIATNETLSETQKHYDQQSTQIQKLRSEVTQAEENAKRQTTQLQQLESQADSARKATQTTESELQSATHLVNKTEQTLVAIHTKIDSVQTHAEESNVKRQHLISSKNDLTLQLKHAKNSQKLLVETTQNAKQALETLHQEKEHLKASLREHTNSLANCKAQLQNEEVSAKSIQSQIQFFEQQLTTESTLSESTKSVLSALRKEQKFNQLTFETLVSGLEIEPRFIPAIETALGIHLEAILTTDSNDLAQIAQHTTAHSLGKATFISSQPHHSEHVQPSSCPQEAISWASDVITASKANTKHLTIAQSIVRKTLIVSDLACAISLQKSHPNLSYVTLQGDLVNWLGAVNVGQRTSTKTSTLVIRNQIKTYLAESAQHEKRASKLNEVIREKQESQKAQETSLQNIANQHDAQEIDYRTQRNEEQDVTRTVARLKDSLERVEHELTTNADQLKRTEQEQLNLHSTIQQEKEHLSAHQRSVKTATEQLASVRTSEQHARQAITDFQLSIAIEQQQSSFLRQQNASLQQSLKELESQISNQTRASHTFQTKVAELNANNHALSEQIENNELGSKQLLEKQRALKDQILTTNQEITQLEHTQKQAQEQLDTYRDQSGKEQLALAKVEFAIEQRVKTISEHYQIELSDFTPNHTAFLTTIQSRDESKTPEEQQRESSPTDWEHVSALISQLKGQLNKIGSVNLDSIHEYDELTEQHQTIKSQHHDLTSAKDELLKVIDKINQETTQLFTKTFDQVRQNFQEMFKVLFGENGNAQLDLTDPDDPLESGIEIIAKPPGKKLQSITLLSGGERSMTAVALLFSIYMVKPSPFCVLDELDAPLDESNISRFIQLLDRFTEQSQFIIVTHNKRTMERADVLYGVTMPEQGVSKPIGMKLEQTNDTTSNDRSAEAKTDQSLSLAEKTAEQLSS